MLKPTPLGHTTMLGRIGVPQIFCKCVVVIIAITAFIVSNAATNTAARAADIRISKSPICNIIIEGDIVPGDYEKLENLINEHWPSYWSSGPSEICLASPGGNVSESMKIGRLIRKLRLDTKVPEDTVGDLKRTIISALEFQDPKANYLCTSACFFIAVAGIDRDVSVDKPLLGIHRPFMAEADLKRLNPDQAIASANRIRDVVESYLKEVSVPLKYVDIMFEIPKDDIRWISPIEYKTDFEGIVPELKDWMSAQCDTRTEIERRLDDVFDAKINNGEKWGPEEEVIRRALAQKDVDQWKCENSLKEKMRESAWKSYRSP
jgi:hypothetical protein